MVENCNNSNACSCSRFLFYRAIRDMAWTEPGYFNYAY